MKEFKVGDKVYCPLQGTKIFTLEQRYKGGERPLSISVGGYIYNFDYKGRGLLDHLPMLHHATAENCELLEKLYGVEFEKPPAKPTSKEIIQAMLARGDKFVCCWLANSRKIPNTSNEWGYIVAIDDDYFCDCRSVRFEYATPFDPATGEAITELPEPPKE